MSTAHGNCCHDLRSQISLSVQELLKQGDWLCCFSISSTEKAPCLPLVFHDLIYLALSTEVLTSSGSGLCGTHAQSSNSLQGLAVSKSSVEDESATWCGNGRRTTVVLSSVPPGLPFRIDMQESPQQENLKSPPLADDYEAREA